MTASINQSIAITSDTDETMLQSFNKSIECLAKNIYFEARGEGYMGQLAVAHVTMNRVLSSGYPSDICGVVYQRNQFSWTSTKSKIRDWHLYEKARDIAEHVLSGESKDPTRGAVSFHNKQVRPDWNKKPVATIGNHIFYK